jgi:hypothetical protein
LDHIQARLNKVPYTWDDLQFAGYSDIEIDRERIDIHRTLRISYTSYDCRQSHDLIKPWLKVTGPKIEATENHSSTILLSAIEEANGNSEEHAFWYAQVLGIFSMRCRARSSTDPRFTRFDVVWVRWFGRDPTFKSGWRKKRLHRVGFVPDGEGVGAFGFVDPKDIVRGCHLIPAFAHGLNPQLMSKSFVQRQEGDWAYYYVNRCHSFLP